jgi:hypothetical protein
LTYPEHVADVENAIHAWIVAATGLPASSVLWGGQGAARPAGPWISISLLGLGQVGSDWIDAEWAEVPDHGAEVDLKARGLREVVLSLQCFAGDAHGVASCVALLERVRAKAPLPGAAELLRAGGVGLSTFGAVNALGGAVNAARFEPRATLEVRCYVASEVSETATYIETVAPAGLVTD